MELKEEGSNTQCNARCVFGRIPEPRVIAVCVNVKSMLVAVHVAVFIKEECEALWCSMDIRTEERGRSREVKSNWSW
jgi:hypothetical protein